jgi:hypothetical protein
MEWSFGGSSSKYVSNNMPTTCNKRFYIFCMQEEFEDTKGVIRIHKSKNDRQHNDQKKKDKQHLQNIHIKLKNEQHKPH